MEKEKPKITFKNFNFWYGLKQILFDIDLSIYKHQITSLIGPSGCGKSTMLRCINRMNDLIPISKHTGKIYYGSLDVNSKETDVVKLRKTIGMVFQKPNPFPMSIFDNIAFGPRVEGIRDKKKLGAIVAKSLMKAELWEEVKDRLDVSAFRLSGGQQQRLCIARSLAINPDVLLLDEPCSALDPIATAKIEQLLLKIKHETTIVIVTHNMQQAKRVSDKAIYLLTGKVIEYGSTTEVFENPKHKLTKEYINGDFG